MLGDLKRMSDEIGCGWCARDYPSNDTVTRHNTLITRHPTKYASLSPPSVMPTPTLPVAPIPSEDPKKKRKSNEDGQEVAGRESKDKDRAEEGEELVSAIFVEGMNDSSYIRR